MDADGRRQIFDCTQFDGGAWCILSDNLFHHHNGRVTRYSVVFSFRKMVDEVLGCLDGQAVARTSAETQADFYTGQEASGAMAQAFRFDRLVGDERIDFGSNQCDVGRQVLQSHFGHHGMVVSGVRCLGPRFDHHQLVGAVWKLAILIRPTFAFHACRFVL